MPTGTTRVTLFGGVSLTPGGTQTFNSPGTFTVPVGISSVTVIGKGGTGNPGNPGGAGNPGSTGTPSTFNAVPVSPGTSYPIAVGPSGQVNISWNPQ